jgi:enoyl-CoA hydratase/carnithine racemase
MSNLEGFDDQPRQSGAVRLDEALAKRAVDAARDRPVEAGLELEADLVARCFASEDGQRGLRGFVDKGPRKASFLGR